MNGKILSHFAREKKQGNGIRTRDETNKPIPKCKEFVYIFGWAICSPSVDQGLQFGCTDQWLIFFHTSVIFKIYAVYTLFFSQSSFLRYLAPRKCTTDDPLGIFQMNAALRPSGVTSTFIDSTSKTCIPSAIAPTSLPSNGCSTTQSLRRIAHLLAGHGHVNMHGSDKHRMGQSWK
jgi:hypothetical protein